MKLLEQRPQNDGGNPQNPCERDMRDTTPLPNSPVFCPCAAWKKGQSRQVRPTDGVFQGRRKYGNPRKPPQGPSMCLVPWWADSWPPHLPPTKRCTVLPAWHSRMGRGRRMNEHLLTAHLPCQPPWCSHHLSHLILPTIYLISPLRQAGVSILVCLSRTLRL
uniref:Uncharacterized protein n=1 Tax=Myotis myotis TaxID=51298 RepID=A0A7J7T6Z5_MYOMY|nr:hypothetical protein mMyoMyo1_009249 [Myotis myotis]